MSYKDTNITRNSHYITRHPWEIQQYIYTYNAGFANFGRVSNVKHPKKKLYVHIKKKLLLIAIDCN